MQPPEDTLAVELHICLRRNLLVEERSVNYEKPYFEEFGEIDELS